jgi:hypothetical protein
MKGDFGHLRCRQLILHVSNNPEIARKLAAILPSRVSLKPQAGAAYLTFEVLVNCERAI